jgi:hypothetical protein
VGSHPLACVQPGVNVTVTIFGDFRQLSAEKIGVFFLKTNVSIQFLSKLAVFGVRKRHFFENVLKIITLTPADTFRNRYPPILTHCSYILRRQLQKELRGASL